MKGIFLSLLMLLTPSVQVGTRDTDAAAELWRRVLAAKGGIDRLHGIDNVLRSARVPSRFRSRSVESPSEELFVFPDRYWVWSDQRPSDIGVSVKSLNFETGRGFFMWDNDKTPRVFVADRSMEGYRLDVLEAIELLETRWVRVRPVRTWSEKKAKSTAFFIEGSFQTTPGLAMVTFTLDEKTLLPKHASVLLPIPGLSTKNREDFELLNYVDIDGIKMPALIRHSGSHIYEEKLEYQFNVSYDQAIFQVGPNINSGSKGWQKR